MSNQDNALPSPPPSNPKDPTPEEVRAISIRSEWLRANIDSKSLRRRAYRFTHDAQFGADIVQDLHGDMLEWSIEELQGIHLPQRYAYRAITHRLLNRKRGEKRKISGDEHFERTPHPDKPLEELWESRDRVLKLLAELPPEWRGPLLLCKVDECTSEEAAKELNLTVDQVKKRVARAVNYLRVRAAIPDSVLERARNFIRRKGARHEK
jgi:RNA polymerase sigma factor (sigma-70 family)